MMYGFNVGLISKLLDDDIFRVLRWFFRGIIMINLLKHILDPITEAMNQKYTV